MNQLVANALIREILTVTNGHVRNRTSRKTGKVNLKNNSNELEKMDQWTSHKTYIIQWPNIYKMQIIIISKTVGANSVYQWKTVITTIINYDKAK